MSDERDTPLDDELQREIEEALGDSSLLGLGKPSAAPVPTGEPASDRTTVEPEAGAFSDAAVAGVGQEDVFIEFGPRAQGVIPADQFATPPEVGGPMPQTRQAR